ncbi:MAG TPA: SgcJ/EcaC family oxidoreductase, partial [Gemmataceae bacterium]|nr:SgcJ/EcaC family oxidoreductase [Gemmataceae bacterium]
MNRHAGVVVAAAALALSVGVGSLHRSAAQDKVPPPARGDDPPGQPERAEDRAALRKRTEEILKAAAKADAKELAGFWTETGEYVRGDDLTIRGRANIEKAYADHFKAKKPGTVELQGESVRFLSDDTAIQEGTFRVKRPNPAEETRSRFSALFVRVKGQWYLGLLREWAEGPSLQELAWLVGTWTSRTDDAEVKAVFEWTEDKSFLRGRFSMKSKGHTATGFQVLALDPVTKVLRSWTFEAGGGLGEAAWTRTDKGWTAKSTA